MSIYKQTSLSSAIKALNEHPIPGNIFVFLLLPINVLWFYGHGFITFMGDDIQLWHYLSLTESPIDACLNISGTRYRPVATVLQYVLFRLFGNVWPLYMYFNILFHTIISIVLFAVIKKITSSNIMAFIISICFVTSKYTYYNILQLFGPMEALCLLLLIIILYISIIFIEKNSVFLACLMLLLSLAAAFTHERYIVISAYLFIIFFISDFNKSLKATFLSLTILPFLLNFLVKAFILDTPFLSGTGGVPIGFNPLLILSFMASGLLNIFGLHRGPDHLFGISFNNMDTAHQSICYAILALNVLSIGIHLILFMASDKEKRRLQFKIIFPLSMLMIALLSIGSISIRQEPRFVHPAYIVFMVLLSYIVTRPASNVIYVKTLKFIVCLLFSLILINDTYYQKFIKNIYFYYSQKISDSLYDKTIGTYGREIANRKIYVEKFQTYDWIAPSSMFFEPYFPKSTPPTINYVDHLSQVCLNSNDERQIVAYRLDPTTLKFDNVTQYLANLLDIMKDSTLGFDFADQFPHGRINDPREEATPTGQGVFLMQDRTLTLLSGFTYTYTIPKTEAGTSIIFSNAMPLGIGDGARAFIEAIGPRGKKRIFESDLPQDHHDTSIIRLSLAEYAGGPLEIAFGVESPTGDRTADWVSFNNAIIINTKVASGY